MIIPFAPPYIDDSVINEVVSSLRSGWITTGPKVKQFEKNIGAYIGNQNVVCINSATSALMLSLYWFGVKEGDEVIIPAYTYAATALVVLHLGAKPVMADCAEDFTIDPSKLAKLITPKTKAIIPVDLGGLPCKYSEIYEVINKPSVVKKFNPESEVQKKLNRVLVLADSAHSFGARYNNLMLGSTADITVFSFHAVKNLTTAEGGAISFSLPGMFNNEEVCRHFKLLSLNGQTKDAYTKTKGNSWKYDIVYPGFKINMPDICAAIGLAQLKCYNKMLQRRKEIFESYNKAFKNIPDFILPEHTIDNRTGSCHIYMLRIKNFSEEDRDKFISRLYEKELSANVHFVPLPMLTLFKQLGYKIKDFPVTYANFKSEITLPLYPQLTNNQVEFIISTVMEVYRESV